MNMSGQESENLNSEIMPGNEKETIHSGVKAWIRRTDTGLGPGGYSLFEAIEEEGSVKKACEKQGLSYSKGWKIIKSVESELGIRIVERQQGGAGGGEAHLSEDGRKLLRLYEIYNMKVAEAAERIFDEVFGDSGLF